MSCSIFIPNADIFQDVGVVCRLTGFPDDEIIIDDQDINKMFELARGILGQYAGIRIQSMIKLGTEVEFGAGFGLIHSNYLEEYSRLIGTRLLPFASADACHVVLLCTEEGDGFAISVTSCNIAYCGTWIQGVRSILNGAPFTPVLPRRNYPQWHSAKVYFPGDPSVYWVDSKDWFVQTRCDDPSVWEQFGNKFSVDGSDDEV